MADVYKKPQSPLYDKKEQAYFYPLTTSDQVILPSGERLPSLLKSNVSQDFSNILEGQPNGINADTLGGKTAEEILSLINRSSEGIKITLLADNWVGESAPYSQTVAVEGMTADRTFSAPTSGDNSQGVLAVSEALGLLCGAESAEGSVTFYASQKPEIDLTVILRG